MAEIIYESEKRRSEPDPDEIPVKDRKVITQPYDLVVESLIDQINGNTIFLRPLSDRPDFQRGYVWTDDLASRLVESILLNVPIPPCYLSQNDDFELDVIDGQQRLYSIYRFLDNQFPLTGLSVLTELKGHRFHEIPSRLQRKIKTHSLRCVVITNESHPEIKFDVFERLNSNTVPLNAQELRNCIYRGSLIYYLKNAVLYQPWLDILNKNAPDKRMRDEELILRFFAFYTQGLKTYRTPQKYWLNDAAKAGKNYSEKEISNYNNIWKTAIDTSLQWFAPNECFRRLPLEKPRPINRALFDLIMITATRVSPQDAKAIQRDFRVAYKKLLKNAEFDDLISRGIDHTKRTKRRFELWDEHFSEILP